MSYVLSKKTVSTAKGVGVSSEKYPKLHLVDVMSDTWYPIPPPPPPAMETEDVRMEVQDFFELVGGLYNFFKLNGVKELVS